MSAVIPLTRVVSLPPVPSSVRAARRFLAVLLGDVGHREWLEAAELAVSEIVTNAVLHAHTAVTLSARVDEEALRVEVRDGNPSVPTQRRYDEQATTGRGMSLVAAITQSHGTTSLGEEGKIVWFSIGPDDGAGGDDVDALLGSWSDDESVEPPPEPRRHVGDVGVTLLGMPPTLWMAAAQHHDALLRELALMGSGRGRSGADLAAADVARSSVSEALERAVADARARGAAEPALPPGHPSSFEDVPPAVDLQLSVSEVSGRHFGILQDVLDQAEALAASDELLVRPGLPEVIAIRDWACEQVIAQVEGIPAGPWLGTDVEARSLASTGADVGVDVAAALGWDPGVVRDSDRGAVAADDANRIVAVSRPFADALGWAVEELVGRRVVALVPPRHRVAHVAGFTRHLTTGEARALGVDLQLPVLRGDGGEVLCSFFIEASSTATGRTIYVAWITPLT